MWQAMHTWPALFDITLFIRQSIHTYVYLIAVWYESLMFNLRVYRSCTELLCWRLLRGTSGESIESCRTNHVNRAWLLCLGSSRTGLLGKVASIYGAHLIDEIKGWKGSTFLRWQPGLYLALSGLFEISFCHSIPSRSMFLTAWTCSLLRATTSAIPDSGAIRKIFNSTGFMTKAIRYFTPQQKI